MTAPDLKLVGLLLLDGEPVACPGCGGVGALTLDRCGPRETWPARLGCTTCGHTADHDTITNGLIVSALAACTGRSKASDRDLFTAEWRGLVLEGERQPELTLDDVRVVVDQLRAEGRKRVRAGKAGVRRSARSWWRGRKQAARETAGQAAGRASSTVLAAAWQARTGGAGPEPTPRRRGRRCPVKGC
ncbi:hypothetical protein, partial [Streptomyces sp. NPDC001380]|uniref:hypothetical protein n=1 Tax=Streptomyces sp. NPDC001380 TaxID=3364566 RepID=UPI0036899536